ncbi:hypothetical protein CORT_0B11580 [Candida orthopsilosis Co 90-125]|uniref:Uncharacterized protein n=1 Tax=Candida orthopsilosis (strain 90-125) TaxID=1136231 RepID=H8X2D5_CANO9|nr:hypothetical protein CORT_0B11580 [Candida orthopsilosis Co 90-125]CCG22857.1 hypothetical protein CORT_0B11580 [Candida orthopsilosis Co 90-125]
MKDLEPPSEETLLNNILPSYDMFKSTISLELEPSDENYTVDPPTYEDHTMTPVTSARESESPDTEVFVDDYSGNSGDNLQDTILAHIDSLPCLVGNPKCDGLDVKITFTETVGQVGIKPPIIDTSAKEFKQGDFLHGYVTIKNTTDQPIKFDMVYVLFEGVTALNTDKSPEKHNFLTMVDLFASWSYANIDRLVTDKGDPHDWCPGEIDPFDGTSLSIDARRLFQPGVTYKRFFTFKIPQKLLDDTCRKSLPQHAELCPTLGINREGVPVSLLLSTSRVRDLSMVNSYISYSVAAIIIGRASNFDIDVDKDRYIIAKRDKAPIRLIPDPAYFDYDANTHYHAFVHSVEELVKPDLSPSMSQDTLKVKQFYHQRNLEKSGHYQCVQPFKKKTLTGSSNIGIIALSSKKTEYCINYTPPNHGIKSEVVIPLELRYSGSSQNPEIKKVEVELVALTIQSKSHPIPIEFTNEMLFDDQEVLSKPATSNFDSILIRKFNNYLQQLNSAVKNGAKIEYSIYRDVKTLASLSTKYINLTVPDLEFHQDDTNAKLNSIPWELEENDLVKKFSIAMNLSKCSLKGVNNTIKGLDKITLVPNFQSCYISRVYYIKVGIKTNGATLSLNLPLRIER